MMKSFLKTSILFSILLTLGVGCTDESIIYDGINQGNYNNDSGTCTLKETGEMCETGNDCCSGICLFSSEAGSLICQDNYGVCTLNGKECNLSSDCCSNFCDDSNKCSDGYCSSVDEACSKNSECCSNSCNKNLHICEEATSECKVSGEICAIESPEDCCSGLCAESSDGQKRCYFMGYCSIAGELCETDPDCCSGFCNDGVCSLDNNQCRPVGELCVDGTECCSGSCQLNEYGFHLCSAINGCKPAGELCNSDSECCSSLGGQNSNVCVTVSDGSGLDVCVEVETCGVTGEICGDNLPGCCGGPDNCVDTTDNVTRCIAPSNCNVVGETCSDSLECCSGNCENQVCIENTCLPDNADCMIGDQCCSGLCVARQQEDGFFCSPECLALTNHCNSNSECCSHFCHPGTNLCEENNN